MECADIKKILKQYDIDDISYLEDMLVSYTEDCDDLHEDEMKNVCLEKKCFNNGIPLCRRVIEVYNKFYKENYKKKYEFVSHLVQNTESSESSINNWLSCKQCKYSPNREIIGTVNSDFIQDICKNLKVKLDEDNVFKKHYKSIEVFTKNLSELTKDNFIPKLDKREKKDIMKKDEQDKLFDIVHSSKDELKQKLSNIKSLKGSDEFKLNLALEAFDRKLDDEALQIVNVLEKSDNYKENPIYLQLKAKLLSNKKNDKEAIKVLEELIEIQSPNIDVETHNLLAASIKREALKEWSLYGRDDLLIEQLNTSKEIYQKIFNINSDYYPAINIVYLTMMISYAKASSKDEINLKIDEIKNFWNSVKLDEKDYWSFITNIEFLIITRQYDKAIEKIDFMHRQLDKDEISEFMTFSTGRQMKMYMKFCNDMELNGFISELNNIIKDY